MIRPQTSFEPYPNPKNSPLRQKKRIDPEIRLQSTEPPKPPKIRSTLKTVIEGNIWINVGHIYTKYVYLGFPKDVVKDFKFR